MTRTVTKSNRANVELFNLIEQVRTFSNQYRNNLVLYEQVRIERAVQELDYALESAQKRPETTEELS